MIDYSVKSIATTFKVHGDGPESISVIIYGWKSERTRQIPSGSVPIKYALERIGLNPNNYVASLFEVR